MSSGGSWLQFGNRMNKFKGSYFQDFADICGNLILRNGGNAYLYAQSNLYMLGGDISMNGYIYCKGVVDLSGNSLSGSGDGGGGGLTSLSIVNVKSVNTSDFLTTNGYANIGSYLVVSGTTTLNNALTVNSSSTFTGHMNASDASFNNISFTNAELKGNIIPDTDAAYDIGSSSYRIRDLYVSNASIWIGDNNKLAIQDNKITMKNRKRSNTDIPKFIRDKISFVDINDKISHIKTFASNNGLKNINDNLSTYTVSDWIKFANKKAEENEDGFTNTNHTAYDIYDLANDFDSEDSGQWTTRTTNVIKYGGAVEIGSNTTTQALHVTGKTILDGQVAIGKTTFTSYSFDVNGTAYFGNTLNVNGVSSLNTTNINQSLNVTQNANITGKLGVGKSADSIHHIDVEGKARVKDDAYFKKSLLIGTDVTTSTLTNEQALGASLYVKTPFTSGIYPDISYNVVFDGPKTLFKSKDSINTTNTNYLEIDANNRSILPYVKDSNGNYINSGTTNGWSLGGTGVNRFDRLYARDVQISTETINIEDASGNKIGMSFDATTGAVNYTVTTKDTADASGETFVIKGVQTQKISSGAGTIDPALLEFTGLSFGDTFDSGNTYDLTSTYTYNLTTTTYSGDGVSTFTNSAGAQGLNSFISATNQTTLLGSLPTKTSVVIRVGSDDRTDGGLNGIDSPGSKVDLTNKVISVSDDDGGTTLKWTLWGSETDLNAANAGNYLNYIELKNINMVSGTYFIAKTPGNLVYNNANEDYLKSIDISGVINGDLFLYIKRSPGNNWTKIPVSLPASGSITTQMLADQAVNTTKIASNAVTSAKINDGAITTNKIADDSITAIKFKAGAITGSIFADDAIDGVKISGNIASSKITGTFDGSIITDNTIVSSKIVDGSITTAKIAYLGVSGDNLMANSVVSSKIADDAVTTNKIVDGAITSSKLASEIINASNLIADNIIIESKINDSAITLNKLASNSVNSSKISDGSITTTKLANGSVTLAKLDSSILNGKQDALIAGSGITIINNIDGDPVISSSGAVGDNSITTAKIVDGAITSAKLDTNAINSKLSAGSNVTLTHNNSTGVVTISSSGGGGGGGGSIETLALGGVPEGETSYAKTLTYIGTTNQKLGSSHLEGSPTLSWNNLPISSISMTGDGRLGVVTDNNKNTLIFTISDPISIKQTINFPTFGGAGDRAMFSKDGTTLVCVSRMTNYQSATFSYSTGIIYVYYDSTAQWDSIPTPIQITNTDYGTYIGLAICLTSDGSKLAVFCCDVTRGPAIAIYSTSQTTSTPIMTITLDATNFPDVARQYNSDRLYFSDDGSRMYHYTKGSIENLYIYNFDYVNLTYTVEYNFKTSTEYTKGALSWGHSTAMGGCISPDGTRVFFAARQTRSATYAQFYFIHYVNGSWVENTWIIGTDILSSAEWTTLGWHVGSAVTWSSFSNNDTITVLGSNAYMDYTRYLLRFEYINNAWSLTYSNRLSNTYKVYGLAVSNNGDYGYVEPLVENYKGKIYISPYKIIPINSSIIKTNKLLLDDDVHSFEINASVKFGDTITFRTGSTEIENGKLFIRSDKTGTAPVNNYPYGLLYTWTNSPSLILASTVTTDAHSKPSIEFRRLATSSLHGNDWNIFSQGSRTNYSNTTYSATDSELVFAKGYSNNNGRRNYFTLCSNGEIICGGKIATDPNNVLGSQAENYSMRIYGNPTSGFMQIYSSNSMGSGGYLTWLGFSNQNTHTTRKCYIVPELTTAYTSVNDFSFTAEAGTMRFCTGTGPGANANNTRMSIALTGQVSIGTAIDTNYKLAVGGAVSITGNLNVTGDITASGTVTSSDDRLKENEFLIDDAVSVIQKLRPEIYDKKPNFTSNDNLLWKKESGLIAQEVWYAAPELRHLVGLGTKIVDRTDKPFTIKPVIDESGNVYDISGILVLDDSGNVLINDNGATFINKNYFILLDNSGVAVEYNGIQALDYKKLTDKHIRGQPFTRIIHPAVYDNSGNLISDEIREELLNDNNEPLIDSTKELSFTTQTFIVENNYAVYKTTYEVPVKPEDIKDISLNNINVQEDPDYTSLGWGDTPASVNYIGLIPYLVKAIQEQQATIEQMKIEIDTLKNR